MTKLLEHAVRKVQDLPVEMQEQAALMLLAYAGDDEPVIGLTPEEQADLVEAQAEMARGESATDTEVEVVLGKYRLRGFATRLRPSDKSIGLSVASRNDPRAAQPR